VFSAKGGALRGHEETFARDCGNLNAGLMVRSTRQLEAAPPCRLREILNPRLAAARDTETCGEAARTRGVASRPKSASASLAGTGRDARPVATHCQNGPYVALH